MKKILIEYDNYKLEKVISGGQTGVDQAGLFAARDCGIHTGGWVPKGYRTLIGNQPELLSGFGLKETDAENYQTRTKYNVRDSDGTIRLASNFSSYGELCTLRAINKYDKPFLDIHLNISNPKRFDYTERICEWVISNNISTLNVAGNADRRAKDGFGEHFQEAYLILVKAFTRIKNYVYQNS